MISGADGGERQAAIGAAMKRHAAKTGDEIDPVLRAELAMFDVDALAYAAMGEKFLDEIKVGKAHPAQPNMMKYAGTELNKRRHELVTAAARSNGRARRPRTASPPRHGCAPRRTRSRAGRAR
jgi:hypothetical protein